MNSQEIGALCDQFSVKHFMFMAPSDDIGSIVGQGLLCYNTIVKKRVTHRSIADPKIQRRRGTAYRIVDGNQKLLDIHEYVPLFIAMHTPMQYVITTSATTKGRHAIVSNEDLVFILIDPIRVMQLPGTLIADGNAAASSTQFFSAPDGLSKLDWDAINSPNEYPQCYDREWKRCKSAEVLVPQRISPTLVAGLVVNSLAAQSRVRSRLSSALGLGSEGTRLTDGVVIDKCYYK